MFSGERLIDERRSNGTQEKPDMARPITVQSGRVYLSDPRIHDILEFTSGFHDALLESSRREEDVWIIEIRHVYFPDELQYDAFGSDGCVVHLSGCNVPEEVVREAQDREFFSFELSGNLLAIVFSFDGMEVTGVRCDPDRSFLEWRFVQDTVHS